MSIAIMIILACAISIAFHIMNKNKAEAKTIRDDGLYDAAMAEVYGTDRLVPPPPGETDGQTNAQPRRFRNGETILREYLQKKGGKLEEAGTVEDARRWLFELQGGHFVASTFDKNDEILLKFYAFASLPYTKANLARAKQLCYKTTSDTKYAKFIYNFDEQTNEIDLMMSVETIGPSDEALDYYIWLIFEKARDVREKLKEPAGEESEEADILRQRQTWITRKLLNRTETPLVCGPDDEVTTSVENIIRTLFDGETQQDMLSLTALGESGTVSLTDGEQIMKWNPTEMMLSRGDSEREMLMTPATISIESVCNHYIFTLHPVEQSKDTITLRLTALRTPIEQISEAGSTPKTAVTLISIHRKEDDEQAHYEYLYKADEAARKAQEGQLLSDEETLLSTLTADEIGERIYHAIEMGDDKPLQRIIMLEPCYQELNNRFFSLTDKQKDMTLFCAFQIGQDYWRLRLYDKALFWLKCARKQGNYLHRFSYYQCLMESGVFYSFHEIEEERIAMHDILEKATGEDAEEDSAERNMLIDYYFFLLKLEAGIFLKVGNHEMLRKVCDKLLENDNTREFAQKMLNTLPNQPNQQ